MKFSPRIVRDKKGGVEIRLSFSFSPEEAKAVERISDDPTLTFRDLRSGGPDAYSKADYYLRRLLGLCHWAFLWDNREQYHSHLLHAHEARKSMEARLAKTKKRRRKK